MKISYKTTPNKTIGRNGEIPRLIVFHRTCGSFAGAVSWLCNPESQASAHFVVAKDGRVTQLVSLSDTAWCNGTSQDSKSSKYYKNSTLNIVKGKSSNANTYTVGIEFEGLSNENGELTEEQLEVGAKLINYIVGEVKKLYDYDIMINNETLVGHCHITPKWKPNCPGKNFPFEEIINKSKGGEFLLEKRIFNINGEELRLDCIIDKGIVYSPVRKIAEELNAVVSYDNISKVTKINSKQ